MCVSTEIKVYKREEIRCACIHMMRTNKTGYIYKKLIAVMYLFVTYTFGIKCALK